MLNYIFLYFKWDKYLILIKCCLIDSTTPQLDKFLTQKDNKVYSRTETIEIYRANMNSDNYNKKK